MSRNLRVLVVDDFAFARQLLRKAMEQYPCDISEAASGAAALKMIEHAQTVGFAFDLIVCDYNMPEMNGLELFALIKARPKVANTKFVLVTAQGDEAMQVNALTLGVTDYLRKPLPSNDVQSRLESIIKEVGAATGARPKKKS